MNRIELYNNIIANIETGTKIPAITPKPSVGIVTGLNTFLTEKYKENFAHIDCLNFDNIDLIESIKKANTDTTKPCVILLDEFDRNTPENYLSLETTITSRNNIPDNVKFIIILTGVVDLSEEQFITYSKFNIQTLNAVDVENTFKACLAKDENDENAIKIEGICHTFVYDKTKIAECKDIIYDMITELPDEFKQSSGGGWSFLQACMTQLDEQWTGSHFSMEKLFTLAMAADLASYLLPRELWRALPGAVPYYIVKDK